MADEKKGVCISRKPLELLLQFMAVATPWCAPLISRSEPLTVEKIFQAAQQRLSHHDPGLGWELSHDARGLPTMTYVGSSMRLSVSRDAFVAELLGWIVPRGEGGICYCLTVDQTGWLQHGLMDDRSRESRRSVMNGRAFFGVYQYLVPVIGLREMIDSMSSSDRSVLGVHLAQAACMREHQLAKAEWVDWGERQRRMAYHFAQFCTLSEGCIEPQVDRTG